MKPQKVLTCPECRAPYTLNRTGRPAVRCPECRRQLRRARDRARHQGEPFRVARVYAERPAQEEDLGPEEPLLVSRAEREAYLTRRILQRHDEGVDTVRIAETVGVHPAEVRRVLLRHKRSVSREKGPPLGLPAWGQ